MLTTLYNVALNPELAKHFRIVITKELLVFFASKKDDAEICFLAKFIRSCLYMLLSRSEMNQVCISLKEADMLAQCLEGRDPFFAGYDNLVTTIRNLALLPKNRKIFFDTGIISTLKELALKNEVNGIFYALLNMISESDAHGETFAHTDDAIRALLTSDSSFMELLCGSNKEVCRGLNLLLCHSGYEKSGMNTIVYNSTYI